MKYVAPGAIYEEEDNETAVCQGTQGVRILCMDAVGDRGMKRRMIDQASWLGTR